MDDPDTDYTDYEKDEDDDLVLERQAIMRALNTAARPFAEPRMRVALGMAVLSELLSDPAVPTGAITAAIEKSEAIIYLRMYPPVGAAS
jgi:hypothetical protein